MAVLPDIDSLGPRPVPRPVRGMAQVSPAAIAAPGRAVQELGQGVRALGDAIFERETTALATDRDTMASNELRELLYNPETGFMSLRGQNAVNALPQFMARLDALRERALDGLNSTARRKLEDSLNRRIDGARQSIDIHTLGERDAWLAGADAARAEAALQDALVNPADTENSIAIIENATRARALREGWDSDRLDVELQAARSGVFVAQVNRIAAADPVAALQYLRENEGRMRPTDVAALEAELQPIVRERQGRALGQEAYAASHGGAPAALVGLIDRTEGGGNYSTLYGHSQRGGRRFAGIDVSAMTIGEAIAFASPSGEYGQWVAANNNGVVATPMGRYQIVGSTLAAAAQAMGLPMDTPFNAQTQDAIAAHLARSRLAGATTMAGKMAALREEWHGFRSVPDAQLAAAITAFEQGDGTTAPVDPMTIIMAEPDPDVRDAAMREYEIQSTVGEWREREIRDAAVDRAFAHIDGGGRAGDLPMADRRAIGVEGMSSLLAYERSRAAGVPIQTDPALYVRLTDLAANDPQAYLQESPLDWRPHLDDADWQHFTDLRGRIAAEGRAPAEVISTATLRGDVAPDLRAAGIEAGSQAEADYLYAITKWAAANPAASQDPVARLGQARRMLVPVLLEGVGPRSRGDFSGFNEGIPAFQVDFDGDPLDPDDDVTLDDLRNGTLTIGEREVSQDQIIAAAGELAVRLRRDPTPQEIIDTLIGTGAFE